MVAKRAHKGGAIVSQLFGVGWRMMSKEQWEERGAGALGPSVQDPCQCQFRMEAAEEAVDGAAPRDRRRGGGGGAGWRRRRGRAGVWRGR